jgi:hypothetical protein
LAPDSLAALCITCGQQLWSHDVGTDPRMRGAIFDPAVRSLVFTPISQGDRVLGVLAVFADVMDAFSAKHLLQLEAAAVEIADVLGAEGRAGDAVRSQFPAARLEVADPDASRPRPPASARLPLPPKDSAEASQESLSAPWKLETEQSPAAVATHRFTTLDAMALRPRKITTAKLVLALTAAVLVIGGGATWAYLATTTRAANSSPATPSVQSFAAGSESSRPGETAALKVDPEAVDVRKGSTFILNVTFSHAPDIASVALQINYDPKVVEFVKVSGGAQLERDGQAAVLAQRDDPVTGTLKISAQRPPGNPGFSADGTALGLVFWAREKGTGNVSIASGAHDTQGRTVDVLGSQAAVFVR